MLRTFFMARSNRIRLAIGTPTTGNVRIEYMESVLNMQQALLSDPRLKVDVVKLLFYCSSVIPKNRHKIVDMARNMKATHILWIDDDMKFPPLAAKALIHGMLKNPEIKILGANCIKRLYPIEFMATYHDDTEVNSYEKEGIEKVRYTGNSFVLMDMSIFDTVPLPWFAFAWHAHSGDFGTEDVFFMATAAQHGIDTYVDHDVSKLIDHIGIHRFQPQDIEGRGKKEYGGNTPMRRSHGE